MKLNESQIAKIDPLLQEVLTGAKGNEVIRAIMSLGDENQIRLNASNSSLKPQQFTSSEAYRQALIDQRKSQLTEVLGDTIEELQQLSLKPVGGGLSRVVVVEGSADAILRSLALSGVNHVTLDQLIALPEVAPDAAVKDFADIYINTLKGSIPLRQIHLLKWAVKSGLHSLMRYFFSNVGCFPLDPSPPLDEKTTKLIYQASEQYIINYHKRHNKLQILGMQQPVDLDSIYISVQCLRPDDTYKPLESLENSFRKSGKRGFQLENAGKQEGIEVANQKQYLMVLGAPGAGKSTFLRKIGLEALKGKSGELQYVCIPVFIELKLFTKSEINIEEVVRESFRSHQFPFSEEFITKALEQGNLLILLDGLDEARTKKPDLPIKQIQSFVDKYKDNQFIISCRTAAYKSQFINFREITIADFDDAQIQQFIQNWFSSEVDRLAGTGDKCWELIKNQKPTKELARTPVLLTFLCLVYDASQDLPKNRATLYKDALDILLKKWAAEKRIQSDPIYSQLGIDLENIMLAEIAYHSFKSQRLFLSHEELVNQIKEFLQNNDNAPKDLDAEAVLNAIAIQQGILVERTRDIYSFSHLTLQEYLTAQYIINKHNQDINKHRQVNKLVTEHLVDDRWTEVFLLIAGLIGGADELLSLMEKEAQKYIQNNKRQSFFRSSNKLQALLEWAEKITVGSEGNYKPVGKRAVAIAIAIAYANAIANTKPIANAIANTKPIDNAIANAIANTKPIDNAIAIANTKPIDNAYTNAITIVIAISNAYTNPIPIDNTHAYNNAYANAIAEAIKYTDKLQELKIFNNANFTKQIDHLKGLKAQISDARPSREVRQACAKGVQKTLLNAFDLRSEMVNLSEEEAKALENYLYANYLIIQCKQAAVRVSPQTWEAIEARMLLVPDS
ncbi:NACHT domain-containing protein [Nostoc sp. CHAB 5784]|uniref:NACHT domain-containing protein n=1 Tax=Nostoc mirabile TaxID=2907820 RepID=UPI001E2E44FA|nr:NACHT domain-containing protein [Nostoc mirabile]MCC5668821.1 NACHT domain-containing protein [Nostoc mirabile CHAB5784]